MQEQSFIDEIRPRHRWTVGEYHRMGEVGLLAEMRGQSWWMGR
jgi:hypothetical protein